MVNILEQHQCNQLFLSKSQTYTKEPCSAVSSMLYILAWLQKFLGHSAYEKKSHLPYKHHLKLFLFCVPSSIMRLCKAIRFPYDFKYRKGKI